MVHRDFYENQILLCDGRVTILDLDTLAIGSPCVDVGNLLAHLYLRDLATSASSRVQTASVIDAYEALAPRLPRRELRFCYAAALLRLGMVHGMRASTGRFSERLLQQAKRVIDPCGSRAFADQHLFGGRPS